VPLHLFLAEFMQAWKNATRMLFATFRLGVSFIQVQGQAAA
jgi:hypothetical protein